MIKISNVDEDGVKNYKTWFSLSIALSILFTWIAVGSAGVLYFESSNTGANITTYGDAFWLLYMACSTIGFGDYYPMTLGGRIVVGTSFFVGVGIAGYIGGILANSVLGFSDTNVKNRELRTILTEVKELLLKLLKQLRLSFAQDTETLDQSKKLVKQMSESFAQDAETLQQSKDLTVLLTSSIAQDADTLQQSKDNSDRLTKVEEQLESLLVMVESQNRKGDFIINMLHNQGGGYNP